MNISKKLIIAGFGLAFSLVSGLAQADTTRCSFRGKSSELFKACLLDITLLNKQIPWVTAKLKISDLKGSNAEDTLLFTVVRNGTWVLAKPIQYPANGKGEFLYISEKIPLESGWEKNPNGTQRIWVELAYKPAIGVSSDETYYLGATLGKYGR